MSIALVALALLSMNAWASVPDPDYCTVSPQDGHTYPTLTGVPPDDALRADGDITIHVAAFGGTAIENCEVLIVINAACTVMCECASWDNPKYTDASGNVTMNLRFGGCCTMDAAATIYADGYPIRSYAIINSPDWSGSVGSELGDCAVLLPDFGKFAQKFGHVDTCSDITGGDGQVLLPDFGLFARQFGHECAQ
ncbi:MAG: hypothetical protein V1774_08455 [Candidatus Eisenbacteria bacterium]